MFLHFSSVVFFGFSVSRVMTNHDHFYLDGKMVAVCRPALPFAALRRAALLNSWHLLMLRNITAEGVAEAIDVW